MELKSTSGGRKGLFRRQSWDRPERGLAFGVVSVEEKHS